VLPLLALPLPAADLPADLAAVPGDAAAFVHLRIAELWKGDAMREVRNLVKKAGPEALRAFDQRFLPAPSSIDRVTLVVLAPASGREPELVVVVATAESFDRDKMLKAAFKQGAERKEGGHSFTVDPKSGIAIHVLDDKTFAVAEDNALRQFLAVKGKGSGSFEPALKDAGKHHILVALNSGLLPGEA